MNTILSVFDEHACEVHGLRLAAATAEAVYQNQDVALS